MFRLDRVSGCRETPAPKFVFDTNRLCPFCNVFVQACLLPFQPIFLIFESMPCKDLSEAVRQVGQERDRQRSFGIIPRRQANNLRQTNTLRGHDPSKHAPDLIRGHAPGLDTGVGAVWR